MCLFQLANEGYNRKEREAHTLAIAKRLFTSRGVQNSDFGSASSYVPGKHVGQEIASLDDPM